MSDWNEIGHISDDITCPKCGGLLLIRSDDIAVFATCTGCMTEFVKTVE